MATWVGVCETHRAESQHSRLRARPGHTIQTLRLQQPAHLTCRVNGGIAFSPRNKAFINWLSNTDDFFATNIQGGEIKRLVCVCALFWSAAWLREQGCGDHKLNLNLEKDNFPIYEFLVYYGTVQAHACLVAFLLSSSLFQLFLSSIFPSIL